MKTIILVILTLSVIELKSQIKNDSMNIIFLFSDNSHLDTGRFDFKVVYQNKQKKDIEIYQSLEEGDRGDRFYNIFIEVQKKENGVFHRYPIRYYRNAMQNQISDSTIRHFDLPKKKLKSLSSDTLTINLLKIAKVFDTGEYRFRGYLRVKTIQNTVPYNDSTLETPPPEDKIEYRTSKWFYFAIKKYITLVNREVH